MDVHVQRADHEVVEHGPVLRDPGAIPRVVADGGRSASGEHRCPGSAQPQAFCGRGSRGGRAQPRQLGTQLRGLDARWRLDLDLIAGELSGDQLSQIRCGPRDDTGGGWLRGPAVWVDEEVLLLDADRGCRPGHDSTASRKARSASSPCTANTTRSRDRESCPRTASTISRAASSSGKPPTPVPNATRASDRQPRSSALDRVDRVAWVMISADVGPPSSIVAAWMTYCAGIVTGGGLDRIAEADRGLLVGLPLHRRTAGAGDRGGHPAAVLEPCIGRIGDRVDVELGHVGLQHVHRDHRCIVSQTPAPQEETAMTETDERQTLADLADGAGWRRRNVDRTDYYVKGGNRVQVIWHGTAAISGGSLYHDDNLTAYTRDLSTIRGWLKR